jgi:hypothetical protein
MASTIHAARAHRFSLFASLIAAAMSAFEALHEVRWRAPWDAR